MVADVMKMDASAFPLDEYDNLVVVASPPCKAFSLAAAHVHMDADVSPLTDYAGESLAMVKETISLVEELQPD
jgi:site-specific DNA-cytosine methylase